MTTPRKKGKPGRVKKWFIGQLKSVLEIAKGLWPTRNKLSLERYFTRRTSGEKLVSLGLVSGCISHKWHVYDGGDSQESWGENRCRGEMLQLIVADPKVVGRLVSLWRL